jgi:hypothetical protein
MNYNEYFNSFINDEDDASCILHHYDNRNWSTLLPMFGVDEVAENEGVDVDVVTQALMQFLAEKKDSLIAYVGAK